MKVTLTIDNGPEPRVTPYVLDELAKRDVKAVFFIIAAKLADPLHRAVALRAHAEGHVVANHSHHHRMQLGEYATGEEAVSEISRAEEALQRLGIGHKLFRPFAGMGRISADLLHPAAVEYMREAGMTCVLWNSVPRDWENTTGWDTILARDIATRDWSVPVIHDFDNGAMKRLPHFLDAAIDAGASFTTNFPQECIIVDRGTSRPDISRYTKSIRD